MTQKGILPRGFKKDPQQYQKTKVRDLIDLSPSMPSTRTWESHAIPLYFSNPWKISEGRTKPRQSFILVCIHLPSSEVTPLGVTLLSESSCTCDTGRLALLPRELLWLYLSCF